MSEQQFADPLDWPIPCDVVVGHVTMRKGVRFGTLVARMRVLYDMAHPAACASKNAKSDPQTILTLTSDPQPNDTQAAVANLMREAAKTPGVPIGIPAQLAHDLAADMMTASGLAEKIRKIRRHERRS